MKKAVCGGYCVITTEEIWNLCKLSSNKLISSKELQILLSAYELKERRSHTKTTPNFTLQEVSKLCGLSEKEIQSSIKTLSKKKLLKFKQESIVITLQNGLPHKPFGTDSNRLIPIPRRLLRVLCSHTKRAQVVVALIHCARGLFLRSGKIVHSGAVKSTWITENFGIKKTTIHAARAWLRSLNFLRSKEGVEQWRQNQFGYYFEILAGSFPKRKKRSKSAKNGALLKRTPFTKVKYHSRESTYGSASGYFEKNQEPNIYNIMHDDLKRLSSLKKLYDQAVIKKWIPKSEYFFRNFVGAAVRAMETEGDSVRIFVGIVKKRLFHFITQNQEERAIKAIKKYQSRESIKNTCPSQIQNMINIVSAKKAVTS